MKAVTLLYHDILRNHDLEPSGFPGAGAEVYKLGLPEFDRHLELLSSVVPRRPESVIDWDPAFDDPNPPVFLTFDDGGESAHTVVRGRLSALGWTGHFFVTGERIETQGFLSADQIRSLHAEGHVIGSHSWSHPARMSACDFDALLDEWRRSAIALSDILGEPVEVASVPGGYYSRRVAEAAAEVGIRFLFTSEPTRTVCGVEDCLVYGRYSITRKTSTKAVAGLVNPGVSPARLSQAVTWQTKKLAKAVLGPTYISAREKLLRLRD